MNMLPGQIDIEDEINIATVDQQLEAIAVDIEITLQVAAGRVGEKLIEARRIHSRKPNGGFKRWVEVRLGWTEQYAYRFIKAVENIPSDVAKQLFSLSKSAFFEVAKADADIQQLIAERVAAGEVFTAAQVKEIKQKAAAEAIERINADAESAKAEMEKLRRELAAKDATASGEVASLKDSIAKLSARLAEYDAQAAAFRKSLPTPKEAKAKAAEEGGVVLASDGKFHSGSSIEQKRMVDAFMFVFSKALDLTENPPSAERVIAGCPTGDRARLKEMCAGAASYLNSIKDLINE